MVGNIFLEILKITIPALIVFATVFYLFKSYLNGQLQMEALKNQTGRQQNILPLKLQAYERLMLLCERITPENLIFRINMPEMSGHDLKQALLIAIQQEFEHNLTQQLYVSESAWKILKLSKEQLQQVISATAGDTSQIFIDNLFQGLKELKINPVDYAKAAIRKEASLLLA